MYRHFITYVIVASYLLRSFLKSYIVMSVNEITVSLRYHDCYVFDFQDHHHLCSACLYPDNLILTTSQHRGSHSAEPHLLWRKTTQLTNFDRSNSNSSAPRAQHSTNNHQKLTTEKHFNVTEYSIEKIAKTMLDNSPVI